MWEDLQNSESCLKCRGHLEVLTLLSFFQWQPQIKVLQLVGFTALRLNYVFIQHSNHTNWSRLMFSIKNLKLWWPSYVFCFVALLELKTSNRKGSFSNIFRIIVFSHTDTSETSSQSHFLRFCFVPPKEKHSSSACNVGVFWVKNEQTRVWRAKSEENSLLLLKLNSGKLNLLLKGLLRSQGVFLYAVSGNGNSTFNLDSWKDRNCGERW